MIYTIEQTACIGSKPKVRRLPHDDVSPPPFACLFAVDIDYSCVLGVACSMSFRRVTLWKRRS